jgi:putative membrane protein
MSIIQQYITKILVTSAAAIIASLLLSGVHINSASTAILVAIVLGLLNTFVKPILIILTIPITIFTLGIFLIVINILMIKWVATLVPGFTVENWWAAFWFSIILSIISSFVQKIINQQQENKEE